jgi:succinate dehydrogenase/fumarate reductase flavoprotein subunit
MTTKVMECDLVVLGAGGSGLVAAVKASEDSGKKVIVLEKAKKPGGSSWFAGGPGVGSMGRMAMGGSGGQGSKTGGGQGGQSGQGGMPQMSGQSGQGSAQGGVQGGAPSGMGGGGMSGMSGFSSWFTTKVGSENFVKTARMEKYKDLPDPSIGPGRGGTFLITRMVEFCQKQGIQILYETPAKKFVTDSNGRITGVLADSRDGQLQINCKACIIAAGGFGRNYEKLKKYWPESYNNKEIFFLCPPGMMGDGIDMAESIGAYIDQTKWNQRTVGGFFGDGPMHHPYSWAVQSLMQGGGFVYIDLNGKRWKQSMEASLGNLPGGVVYSVGDKDIVEAAGASLLSGNSGMGGMMAQNMSDPNSNESKAIKKWREDLEYEVAIDEEGTHGHHAKKGNSLVELALKMDIDPATFVKTIEEYNKAVESGKTQDLVGGMPQMGGQSSQGGASGAMGGQSAQGGAPGGMQAGQSGGQGGQGGPSLPGMSAQSLKPIKTPPFYAIYGHRFSQCTKGLNGIAVNPSYEVLNPKGEIIAGLWAAGDNCTIYGKSSAAASGGNILSTTPTPCDGAMNAFSSGYNAGVKAAEYLKKI